MTRPADSEIQVGAVLKDTYELTSLLGQGGMGSVFLARHRRLPGRQVAVKVLQGQMGLNPELAARFRREAEIASQLGHPNIVEVLDFDTLPDGTPFLVMELLRGESLEERLLRGRLPLPEVLSITRQIGSALQAAHGAGVVHRDLKPANVFLLSSEDGGAARVKLLDFGISKILDSQTVQTQEAVLIGTPQYMAPEQALGKNREVDARTDLFALGCIVYEMLSGTPPFAGDGGSIVQVIFRIVHEQPEPLAALCPHLPVEVISSVERALAKSPQDRHPDVASFIAELTGSPLQALSGVGAATYRSPRATPMPSAPMTGEYGFEATLVPSSAPAAKTDEVALDATFVPSSTARMPAPVAAPPAPPAPPVVPLEPVVVRSKSKAPVVAGAVVLLLAVAVPGVWLAFRTAPAPAVAVSVPEPVAELASAPEVTPPPEALPAVVAPPPPEPSPVPAPQVVEAKATLTRQPVRKKAESEDVPEEVERLLEEAERSLDSGDTREAIRLARLSQRTHATGDAVSLLARAYCQRKDLSNARAQWRSLPLKERRRVRRYCKQHEFDF